VSLAVPLDTNYEVYAQRPYDSDLLTTAIDRHQALVPACTIMPAPISTTFLRCIFFKVSRPSLVGVNHNPNSIYPPNTPHFVELTVSQLVWTQAICSFRRLTWNWSTIKTNLRLSMTASTSCRTRKCRRKFASGSHLSHALCGKSIAHLSRRNNVRGPPR
jgi:hypothetical protein